MVVADSTTLDTEAISVPVRWDDETQLCKAWFSIDGIYNGVRYRDYLLWVCRWIEKRR